jgi:hypothetical protein
MHDNDDTALIEENFPLLEVDHQYRLVEAWSTTSSRRSPACGRQAGCVKSASCGTGACDVEHADPRWTVDAHDAELPSRAMTDGISSTRLTRRYR